MTTRSRIADAAELAGQAKELTTQARTEVERGSVAWTFLSRAHDELLRAIVNFDVASDNINKGES